ncbi:hypothetical protein N8Z80_05955 [Litorivicinus sp.]|nr:hypothetical protein [Litorivicinus sp.]
MLDMASIQPARQPVRGDYLNDEYRVIYRLINAATLSKGVRVSISKRANEIKEKIESLE